MAYPTTVFQAFPRLKKSGKAEFNERMVRNQHRKGFRD